MASVTSADGSDMAAAPKRRWLSKGYLVTMGTVLAVTVGLGLTVLGLAAFFAFAFKRPV